MKPKAPRNWGRQVLPALLMLSACAASDSEGNTLRTPPDGGAFSRVDSGVPGGPGESQLLFFIAGTTAYAANAAGAGVRPLCPASAIEVDALGERILCVPADDTAPLILYDVEQNRVLTEIADWTASGNGRPLLSPSGERVAVKARSEGRSVVRVYDDNGGVVDEIAAFEVVGFAAPDVVVTDGATPALWRFGQPAKPLSGLMPLPVGPEPAGAVYDVAGGDFHVDFEGFDETRTLAPGQIAGVAGTRVLARTITNEATVVDVADPEFSVALDLPNVPFDRTLGVRMPSPDQVIVELRSLSACNAVQQARATKSFRLDVETNTRTELADTEGPHEAQVAGDRALVLDLDPCGVPTGTATLIDDGDDEALSDRSPGMLTAAQLSAAGRFVAVGYADRVAVVDIDGDQLREVVAEGPGRAFVFR